MFRVRVADRAEDLVDLLVDRLATPLADPFQAEWVAVPSLGFRSWLRFRLAERLGAGAGQPPGTGIAANLEMPFPGALRWRILRAHGRAEGRHHTTDPWEVERLVWSVLDVMADPTSTIHERLRRAALPPGVTLASRAGPVADLFDRYGVHRPDLVQQWAQGRDVGPGGEALAGEHRWQPELYRAVRQHIAQQHAGLLSPAERLATALHQVAEGTLDLRADAPGEPGLPPRIFVVGPSILGGELGPLLAALSHQCAVEVLLLSPSPATTCRLAAEAAAADLAAGATSWGFPRATATATGRPGTGHPLLDVWGRRPLESALLLGAGGVVPRAAETSPTGVEPAPGPAPSTLLGAIQADLRAGRPPEPVPAPAPDGSLQVHAAPGRTRQVEVLRDVILGLLHHDPTLTERDIAVLCPRLEEFSATVTAVLGPSAPPGTQPEPDRVPSLRYSIIDRDARTFNPVLAAMTAVIDLLPGRFDAAAVRDLLHAPAVMERFGLTTDDLGLLSQWIDDAEIRWGLDGPHREPWGLGTDHRANSWAAGIDQLMAGVALGDPLRRAGADPDEPAASPHALAVGRIAPVELAEGALGSAGRLAAAIRTLSHVRDRLLGPAAGSSGADQATRPIAAWQQLLTEAADLLVAPAPFEDWQRAAFDDAVAHLVADAADHTGTPSATPLSFGDVRRLLAPTMEGARARADLGFGSVVFARPSLLAGVPFRVVCILGLDDDAMPAGTLSGDDLLAAHPFVGDREPRGEARAELLAAIQSAREHLVITCSSRNVRTNEPVPRAVALEELLDLVAATLTPHPPPPGTDDDPRARVVRGHPRQAFDLANFDTTGPGGPFSFDPAAREGAQQLAERLAARSRTPLVNLLLTHPLDPPADAAQGVLLEDLRSFHQHPVKHFFRNRLRVTLPTDADDTDTELPTTIDRLQASGIGRDLVAIGTALADPEAIRIGPSGPGPDLHPRVAAVLDHHRARGLLPPPAAAHPELAAMTDEIAEMLTLAREMDALRPADGLHRVDLLLPDGTRVHGSVGTCCDGPAPGPLHVRYTRFKPKHLAAMAVDLLALTAMWPDQAWRGVLVARGDKSRAKLVSIRKRVAGVTARERHQTALEALDALVAQFRDGRCYPLPLFDRTSFELIEPPTARGRPAGDGKARSAWGQLQRTAFSYDNECLDPYHQLAFGAIEFDALRAADLGGHRLDTEAERLWGTLHRAVADAPIDEEVPA